MKRVKSNPGKPSAAVEELHHACYHVGCVKTNVLIYMLDILRKWLQTQSSYYNAWMMFACEPKSTSSWNMSTLNSEVYQIHSSTVFGIAGCDRLCTSGKKVSNCSDFAKAFAQFCKMLHKMLHTGFGYLRIPFQPPWAAQARLIVGWPDHRSFSRGIEQNNQNRAEHAEPSKFSLNARKAQ